MKTIGILNCVCISVGVGVGVSVGGEEGWVWGGRRWVSAVVYTTKEADSKP